MAESGDYDAVITLGAVIRGDQRVVPGGDFQFQEGDETLVFTLTEALPELERMFRGR